jgi:putative spermidine/putrescine transport system substrate-binding protein
MRRTIRYITLAMALAVATLGTAQQLIVNSYGGEYEGLIHEAIIRPFEEQFGVTVIYDAVGSAAEDYARIRATRGNPGFDVVVMTAPESLQGCREGFLLEMTEETVPNLAHLNRDVRESVGPCGAVHELQYMSLFWRTDRVTEPPTSWHDLWDEQFTGHVAIPNITSIMAVYLLQMASVINGGSLSDLDPGFAAIAELAPRTAVIESSSAVLAQYVERDEAWILPYWSGRAQFYKDEGWPVDFTIPAEGTIPLLATLNIPVNAANQELALQFVNFWLEKTQQENWALAYNVGSARQDLELPSDFAATQITSVEQLEQLLLPDQLQIAIERPQWAERWQREIHR